MSAPPAGTLMAHLEATLGLSFTGPRRERLIGTIEAERTAAGLSPAAFLQAVSRPGRAYDRLIAKVTVGETYFFRDRAQCDLLRDLVLPELARDGRHLTFWSAGCASGEEVYTLAALAHEAGFGTRCSVVGSDASARAVEQAMRASYGPWSMRAATPVETAAHFQQRDGRWQVRDELRQRTRFLQRNLLDGPPPPGRFDLVLCRNLLIYLTRDAVQRAADVLASALAPGGWLITAAGDPPLQAVGLEPVRTELGLAYRRADSTPLPAAVVRPATASPTRRARARQPAAAPVVPAETALGAPTSRRQEPPAAAASTQSLADRVRALGDAGRLEEACRAAAAAVEAHPLDLELRYVAGVVLLEAGRLDEASAAAASAVYLGPEAAAAHLLLGQVEHARGNREKARRSFRNGSRLLAAGAADAPVELAGDLPAGHLAATAAHYLAGPEAGR